MKLLDLETKGSISISHIVRSEMDLFNSKQHTQNSTLQQRERTDSQGADLQPVAARCTIFKLEPYSFLPSKRPPMHARQSRCNTFVNSSLRYRKLNLFLNNTQGRTQLIIYCSIQEDNVIRILVLS